MTDPARLAGGPTAGFAAHAKFAAFVAIVLGLPAVLMIQPGQEMADLGKLALILSPALAGLILNGGLGRRTGPRRWRIVALAFGLTLLIAAGALAVSLGAGASRFGGPALDPATALGATALTSVLEELGWAGGGLALALKAWGRRTGVIFLGLAWAAWHLVPTFLHVGLFPELEAAPPAMLAAFVVSCLIYRELLTELRLRAGTWLAAAAAHAGPNMLLTGFVTAGLVLLPQGADWRFFPAPGGLVFPILALVAVVWLRARPPAGRAL